MDADANLAEQMKLAETILAEKGTREDLLNDGYRLAELVQALDGWIRMGGYLPADWSGPRRTGEVMG